jgi:hypothetical protein
MPITEAPQAQHVVDIGPVAEERHLVEPIAEYLLIRTPQQARCGLTLTEVILRDDMVCPAVNPSLRGR